MSDPAWARGPNIYEDGPNFSFSNFQTFTHTAGNNGQIAVPNVLSGGWEYFELRCITGESSGSGNDSCAGVVLASYSGPNIRNNYTTPGSIWVAENGAVFSNGSYVGYSISPVVSGVTLGWLVNTTLGYAAVTQNGTVWNNGATLEQVLAGEGVIAIGTSGALMPFVSLTNSTETSTWAVAASVTNCVFPLPSGASYLPANAILSIASADYNPGAPLQVVWAAANVPPSAALEVSLDGGAPLATGGTNTGNSGTLTCATVVAPGFHTVSVVDPGNPTFPSAGLTFYARAATDGAVLASTSQTFVNFGMPENTNAVTLTLNNPTSEIVFELDTSVVGTYGYYYVDFAFYSTAVVVGPDTSDSGVGYIQGPTADGTGYKVSPFGQNFGEHLSAGSFTATMAISSSGAMDYTVVSNSSTVTGSNPGPPANGQFGALVITPDFYVDQEKFVVNAVVRGADGSFTGGASSRGVISVMC